MKIYIDKTAPNIIVTSESLNETYAKTDLENIIKENKEIQITTNDNVEIDYNEYYYNLDNNDFTQSEAIRFESGTNFTEDGYYKFVAVDTSGNKTEIIILIDKTPPEVEVNYFKKGEETAKTKIIKVAGVKKYLSTENVVNKVEENIEELQENENVELENTTTQEIIVENTTETIEEKKIETITLENEGIALASSSTSIYVSTESEFRNALSSKYGTIITKTSINFYSPIYITYEVTVTCSSNENALRYSGTGNFIIIQNGGILNLKAMVVDGRSLSANNGINCINIQSGGKLRMQNSSIIDGGLGNTRLLFQQP